MDMVSCKRKEGSKVKMYVRTKDGIYELAREFGEWVDVISNFERKMKCQCCMKKSAIIKQADTVKELCDEFVIFNPTIEQKEYLVKWLGKDKIKYKTGQQQEGFIMPYETLYGAIWTDKGLIYVAKMNKKGELELL